MKIAVCSVILTLILTSCQTCLAARQGVSIGSINPQNLKSDKYIADTKLSGSDRTAVKNAASDDKEVSANFMTGSMSGHTTYKIDFKDGVSQLEFPLESLLFGVDFCVRQKGLENEWHQWEVGIKSLISLAGASGALKDSDWLTNATDIAVVGQVNNGLDIYSESTAKMFAQSMEINGVYNVFRNEKIAAGILAGYIFQSFEYDVSDVEQVGYGAYAPLYTGIVNGDVLDYQVEYRIPYLGINSDIVAGEQLDIKLQMGYSNIVHANDTDDHLLRNKISENNCQGNAVLFRINAEWTFRPSCLFHINGFMMKIDTIGTQVQYWYGDDPAGAGDETGASISGIDSRIRSMQQSVMIGVRFSF
ncbi:MAG: omptin family outer membrane protease [Planctomycetes bacterium]|nr:omptin family outer membrane protease [Planctomycetota bacterium]